MWPFSKNKQKSAPATDQMTLQQLIDFLGLHDTTSEDLSEATYFACLKVLSETMGKLPLKIMQATDKGGVKVAREHPYYRMLNVRPNKYMTASTFWATMELCRDHYGNGYAYIDTRNPKKPQLWIMHPENVRVYYDDARKLADVPDVYYQYSTPGGILILKSEEVIHVKSHFTLDGLVGISVREQLATTLGGGSKAQKMLNAMYNNGMTAKAVLQYTGSLNDKNVETLVKGISEYASQTVKGKGKGDIIPVPVGYSLTPLNLKLADSQFLELRQFNALQIASAFGIKPYQIGDYTKSSYASAEAQQLSFLVDTMLYPIKQYEEELSYKILADEEYAAGYFTRFNTGVILRADQRTQIETMVSAVSNFLLTPNEARENLDRPALPGGDQLIGNGSTIPLGAVGAQWQAQAPTTPATTE